MGVPKVCNWSDLVEPTAHFFMRASHIESQYAVVEASKNHYSSPPGTKQIRNITLLSINVSFYGLSVGGYLHTLRSILSRQSYLQLAVVVDNRADNYLI